MTATSAHAEGAEVAEIASLFRDAMRTVTGTVMLVTARDADGGWRGMAATAFSSVSLDPPACLVCINRGSSVHPALIETGRFCVNVMHLDHHELMPSFTKPEFRAFRFSSGEWECGGEGLPFLVGAQSNVFCTVRQSVPVGTHDVLIGAVFAVRTRADHDPLLYGNGAYLRQGLL
ncbi:flavin reductase family protein [Microbaculum marinum]|uniref:Flavin reductase family protein n=1 Tax=Microbaculum marinum TaxID=1764581 RepID=A0AAW9RTB3_9HYPH